MPQGGQSGPSVHAGRSTETATKTSEGLAANVERVVAPTLTDMGYEIVRILYSSQRPARLQIMAERRDRAGMTVEDCAEISRAAGALLEVEDPIAGAYHLEVSSPGIDRPLTRLDDFDRFAGFEAKLEMQLGVDGQRRFSGRLRGLEGDLIRLETGSGDEVLLPFAGLAKAKLLLTDELLTASQMDADQALASKRDNSSQDRTDGLI